jgi:hypothetical protein
MVLHRDRMTSLADLRASAPTIAAFFEARVAEAGLVLLGTTRSDGWPRVSPIELSVRDDRLYVGSMPAGVKALDLRRDPRCCILTPLADKDDLAGEGKAFCRAREIREGAEWEAIRAAWKESLGFDIGQPGSSHMFELEIEAASWQRVEGDDWRTTSWRAGSAVRERVRSGPTGERRDL